jgi:biotin carboxylase
MSNILIIGASNKNAYKDLNHLISLQDLGHNIFVLQSEMSKGWSDGMSLVIADLLNLENTISKISAYSKENNISFDAIFTFKERFVLAASVLAQAFNCVHTPIKSISNSSVNKLQQRKLYNTIKNPNMGYIDYDIIFDLNALPIINKDKVIKPIMGTGSAGVQKISKGDVVDLKFIGGSLKNKYETNDKIFMLEDYIDGKVYSIDGIVQNQQVHFAGINEYIYGKPPYFIQTGNIIPADLKAGKQNFCFESVEEIIRHLEFNDCPFHAEIALKDNKAYLIEIACRMPGGQIPRGYELAYGFNFSEQVANLYLGKEVSFKKSSNWQVIQKGIHLYENVEILDVNIPDKTTGEIDFAQVSKAGDINSYPLNNKPIYYYAVREENLELAKKKCAAIEKSVKIKTGRQL